MNNERSTRARETELLARLYKQLRIADQNEPLSNESRHLFNEIQKALIDATREIYEPRINEDRAKQTGSQVEKD